MAGHDLHCVLAAEMANHTPGCIKRSMVSMVSGGDSAPLIRAGETLPGVLSSALESSVQKGQESLRAGPQC